MASKVSKVIFNNGLSAPAIGLGTWKSLPGEVEEAVKIAIDIGYRHIDTAFIYQNEKEIGAAIREKINDGTVKREDLFITTKLWNSFHDPKVVEKSCRESLKNLGLDYVDLYLIHHPMAFIESENLLPKDENGKILYSNVDYVDTYLAMEKLIEKGLTKSIGVSNLNHFQLERVLEKATVIPVTNQVECHPYLAQKKLSAWMKDRQITLTAYSPLGSGDRPRKNDFDKVLLQDPLVAKIAAKYNKTPAQILLRYHVERGFMVVPKSVSKKRLQENFDIFDFQLKSEDMKELLDLDCNGRYLTMEIFGTDHENYPFNAEF